MPITLNSAPRVALFPDTFQEANGVATLSRQLAGYAKANGLPFLVVRGGEQNALSVDGSLQIMELKRGPAAFPLDKTLYCDPFLTRHKQTVIDKLLDFKPDLVHITGPGDLGFLGLWVAHILRIPLVASWHTNLHEYLAKRLDRALQWLPKAARNDMATAIERQSLRGLLRFYRTARFVLAPNKILVDLIHARTGRPAFVMEHGVDLAGYQPSTRTSNGDRPFCIGYVGRLTAEKNVREFVGIERRLIAAGEKNYKFLIVGEGGQQKWLNKHLQRAEFRGVLRGKALADAYSRMDAFVFPSRTDTFGLVILEAMASGVPVILAPETGAMVGVENGVSGLLSQDFAASLQSLMHNSELRMAMSSGARSLANTKGWSMVFDHLYDTYSQGLMLQDQRRELKEARV